MWAGGVWDRTTRPALSGHLLDLLSLQGVASFPSYYAVLLTCSWLEYVSKKC